MFFTTTVLDFVHVFAEPRLRTEMAVSLIEEHARLEVPLHAYVVMPRPMCESAQQSRWSSARAHALGHWRPELGLDLGAVIDSLREQGE